MNYTSRKKKHNIYNFIFLLFIGCGSINLYSKITEKKSNDIILRNINSNKKFQNQKIKKNIEKSGGFLIGCGMVYWLYQFTLNNSYDKNSKKITTKSNSSLSSQTKKQSHIDLIIEKTELPEKNLRSLPINEKYQQLVNYFAKTKTLISSFVQYASIAGCNDILNNLVGDFSESLLLKYEKTAMVIKLEDGRIHIGQSKGLKTIPENVSEMISQGLLFFRKAVTEQILPNKTFFNSELSENFPGFNNLLNRNLSDIITEQNQEAQKTVIELLIDNLKNLKHNTEITDIHRRHFNLFSEVFKVCSPYNNLESLWNEFKDLTPQQRILKTQFDLIAKKKNFQWGIYQMYLFTVNTWSMITQSLIYQINEMVTLIINGLNNTSIQEKNLIEQYKQLLCLFNYHQFSLLESDTYQSNYSELIHNLEIKSKLEVADNNLVVELYLHKYYVDNKHREKTIINAIEFIEILQHHFIKLQKKDFKQDEIINELQAYYQKNTVLPLKKSNLKIFSSMEKSDLYNKNYGWEQFTVTFNEFKKNLHFFIKNYEYSPDQYRNQPVFLKLLLLLNKIYGLMIDSCFYNNIEGFSNIMIDDFLNYLHADLNDFNWMYHQLDLLNPAPKLNGDDHIYKKFKDEHLEDIPSLRTMDNIFNILKNTSSVIKIFFTKQSNINPLDKIMNFGHDFDKNHSLFLFIFNHFKYIKFHIQGQDAFYEKFMINLNTIFNGLISIQKKVNN